MYKDEYFGEDEWGEEDDSLDYSKEFAEEKEKLAKMTEEERRIYQDKAREELEQLKQELKTEYYN